jgi:hypothetical protein
MHAVWPPATSQERAPGYLEPLRLRYDKTREEEYTIQEYLEICKRDHSAYATASERMLAAIGEPELVDTRHDQRLSRIFSNKVIKVYPAFREFYGTEEVIEQVVAYFRHAAQGLEEKKQILYLLGPVGGGKSSIAEKLKELMEQVPFYCLKGSPLNESPLGLFNVEEDGAILEEEFGIPRRYLKTIPSPWAVKRLHEFNGDIGQFKVVKRYPRCCGRSPWPRPSRVTKTTRTSARWWARWTSASWKSTPRTTGRLQLLRRPVPGQPGPAGIRGNVQGADQGAAPAADCHPGRQLQGHRRLWRDSLRWHRAGALQ